MILFSREYGKITAWSKSYNIGDIGSIVEIFLERKNGLNLVKQETICYITPLSNWKYQEILEYLHLFSLLYDSLPDGSEHMRLYDDLLYFIKNIEISVGKVGQLIIMQARVMKMLGYLNPDHFRSIPNLEGLYFEVLSKSMKSMLSDSIYTEVQYSLIKTSILDARHSYLYRA